MACALRCSRLATQSSRLRSGNGSANVYNARAFATSAKCQEGDFASRITINADRVLDDLHTLRTFGAADTKYRHARGGDGNPKGVVRPACTPADIDARLWLMERAQVRYHTFGLAWHPCLSSGQHHAASTMQSAPCSQHHAASTMQPAPCSQHGQGWAWTDQAV